MVDTKTIAELSDLAKELNSQTDSLNKSIEALNLQLAKLNLGLEYWLPTPIEGSGILQDQDFHPPQRYEDNAYLGYAKLGDAWQLAIREEHVIHEWNPDEKETEFIREYAYTPLLKASRDLRLRAIEQMDNLLRRMTEYAQEKLETIKRAKELAKAH